MDSQYQEVDDYYWNEPDHQYHRRRHWGCQEVAVGKVASHGTSLQLESLNPLMALQLLLMS
jgi:hypothetical protein